MKSRIFFLCNFHFFKILNAASEKIKFLWNCWHLFPVFYEGNTSINDSFWLFWFFLIIISWKGSFFFQWGGGCFSASRASFLSGGGGTPLGHQLWQRLGFKKLIGSEKLLKNTSAVRLRKLELLKIWTSNIHYIFRGFRKYNYYW